MKDKLKRIISYFGINNQQRKLQEEIFELQEAITKYEYSDFAYTTEIMEEMADVLVLLEQIRLKYKISLNDLRDEFIYKVVRTNKRIRNDEYNRVVR